MKFMCDIENSWTHLSQADIYVLLCPFAPVFPVSNLKDGGKKKKDTDMNK